MSDCYFVGRQELLRWAGELLREEVARVEDCASGHQYCLLLDACYPGSVPLARVRFHATQEWEREENLKIVQDVLARHGVDRTVDVARLARGKYQDNLEFLQWFRWFFDQTYAGDAASCPAAEARARWDRRRGQARPAPQAAPAPAAAAPEPPLAERYEQKQREARFYFGKLREIELYLADLRERYARDNPGEPAAGPYDLPAVAAAIERVLFARPGREPAPPAAP